jgi:hypothetical protein
MPTLPLLFAALFVATAQAAVPTFGHNVVPYIPQSFYFDWNDPTVPLPNPATGQCDTISIKWSRGDAQGYVALNLADDLSTYPLRFYHRPNPVSPYKLLVHTSAVTVPYVIDAGSDLKFNWTIPFTPGTQYHICMFDKNGATGGCQAIYTMYPSLTNSTGCANLTLPSALEVDGFVENGPLSRYGWIDQVKTLDPDTPHP